MNKVHTNVSMANLNGAIHQGEGVIIDVDDGNRYSFVPITSPVPIDSGDIICSGTVTLMDGNDFTDDETAADLHIRGEGTPDRVVEIDILRY